MPPSQDLINAFVGAAHGDLAAVQALLAQHPGLLLERASWDEGALEAAAQVGSVPIAEFLLAAGAPLDLCTAIMLGRADDVTRLLPVTPGGANATGAHGLSALYHAVVRGQRAVAEQLLAAGARIDGTAPAGAPHTTPLHAAALFNQPEMARWLLAHGADPSRLDPEGHTPLQVAEARGHAEVAAVLEL
jgi:ankyrin repeat protein